MPYYKYIIRTRIYTWGPWKTAIKTQIRYLSVSYTIVFAIALENIKGVVIFGVVSRTESVVRQRLSVWIDKILLWPERSNVRAEFGVRCLQWCYPITRSVAWSSCFREQRTVVLGVILQLMKITHNSLKVVLDIRTNPKRHGFTSAHYKPWNDR